MTALLAGRVAFVTGAGRGIGRAIARAYAREGAAVTCAARSVDEIDAVAQQIRAEGGQALDVPCDVADLDSVERAVAQTVATFGGIDLVVANAGTMNPLHRVGVLDPAEFRRVLDVNLMGVYHCAHATVNHLRARGGGHLIVIGSGAGRRAGPGFAPYATSKAAAAMLVRILAQELRADEIAVNEIVPGPVMTRLAGSVEDDTGELGGQWGDARVRFPVDEWVKSPDDVVPLALFLATQPRRGPTGQMYSLLGRDG